MNRTPVVAGNWNPKKKRSPWLWVSVGLVVALCLGFIAFALSNHLIELLEAQGRANDNPNDPNAQLNLALAFWKANMPGATYDTLETIVKLAGPDNEPFYTQAGDKFASLEGWLPAASMYFKALKTYGLNQEPPEDLRNAFHEAVYKAADHPEIPIILPFDDIAQVDHPIALIARARNSFYTGRVDDAYAYLDQVNQLQPRMPEAILLEAEFAAAEGRLEMARILTRPIVDEIFIDAPQWIRIYAEEILKRLP